MKRVLVTGTGRGIGFATARAFASAGWNVVSLDKEFTGEIVRGLNSIYGESPGFQRRSIRWAIWIRL
jgi:NAD(P)-dependent dehydrogenase (short-subunit alcohol dehydrogenase family)